MENEILHIESFIEKTNLSENMLRSQNKHDKLKTL